MSSPRTGGPREWSTTASRVSPCWWSSTGERCDRQAVLNGVELRQSLERRLAGPGFGELVDFGSHDGTPFLDYTYTSAVSVDEVLEKLRERGRGIPVDIALLVCERIALSLGAAWNSRRRLRPDAARLLHPRPGADLARRRADLAGLQLRSGPAREHRAGPRPSSADRLARGRRRRSAGDQVLPHAVRPLSLADGAGRRPDPHDRRHLFARDDPLRADPRSPPRTLRRSRTERCNLAARPELGDRRGRRVDPQPCSPARSTPPKTTTGVCRPGATRSAGSSTRASITRRPSTSPISSTRSSARRSRKSRPPWSATSNGSTRCYRDRL